MKNLYEDQYPLTGEYTKVARDEYIPWISDVI